MLNGQTTPKRGFLTRAFDIVAGSLLFYVHRFLFGFCSHPILPVILLVLVALSLGFGEGFGVTDLIYHENHWQQVFGGVVLGFVIVACGYAGFLFDTIRYPLNPKGKSWFEIPHFGFWIYFAFTIASFVATLGLIASLYFVIVKFLIWSSSISGLTKLWNPFSLFNEANREYQWFPIGLGIGIFSAFILGTISYFLSKWLSERFSTSKVIAAAIAPPKTSGSASQPIPANADPSDPMWDIVTVQTATDNTNRAVKPEPASAPAVETPVSRFANWLWNPRTIWLGDDEYPPWWLSVWLLLVFLVIHLISCLLVNVLEVKAWVGTLFTALLLALVCLARRHQLGGLLRERKRRISNPAENPSTGLDEYHYRGAGALFVLFALVKFILVDNLFLNSEFGEPTPVPLFGMAIFVLVALYTGIIIAYRRALPVIILGALVLLVSAGIPPYKFRFPGVVERYRKGLPADPLDAKNGVVNLRERAKFEGKEWSRHQLQLRELSEKGCDPICDPTAFSEIHKEILAADYRLIPSPTPNWKIDFANDWYKPAWRDQMDAWRKKDEVIVPYYRVPFAALDEWPAKPTTTKKPLFIISVSGGGHAAAVWTLGVLNRLEREFAMKGIDFPAHVLLITGASGGMMGAAYYTTSLPEHSSGPKRAEFIQSVRSSHIPCEECMGGRLGEDVQHLLEADFLSPLVNRMLFNDVPAYFSPFPNFQDRGRRLEQSWQEWVQKERVKQGRLKANEDNPTELKSPFSLTFAELREREKSGRAPFLVFAPMMIEDGRRLLISNLDLESVASNDGNGLDATTADQKNCDKSELNYNYSRGEMEFFRLFPEQHKRFRLSTAVRMSATFPFFSPAVSLPTAPRRRVVDAGYYDNYGVCAAASWLFSSDNQKWMNAHVSKVAVIQIRASSSEKQRRLEEMPEPQDHLLSRALEELLSPVEGLNQARVGSATFRNDGQLELLSKYFRELKDGGERRAHADRYFTTVTFELPADVTLSWYLGRKDRTTIHNALVPSVAPDKPTDLDEKVGYLLEWYKRPHKPVESPNRQPYAVKK